MRKSDVYFFTVLGLTILTHVVGLIEFHRAYYIYGYIINAIMVILLIGGGTYFLNKKMN